MWNSSWINLWNSRQSFCGVRLFHWTRNYLLAWAQAQLFCGTRVELFWNSSLFICGTRVQYFYSLKSTDLWSPIICGIFYVRLLHGIQGYLVWNMSSIIKFIIFLKLVFDWIMSHEFIFGGTWLELKLYFFVKKEFNKFCRSRARLFYWPSLFIFRFRVRIYCLCSIVLWKMNRIIPWNPWV